MLMPAPHTKSRAYINGAGAINATDTAPSVGPLTGRQWPVPAQRRQPSGRLPDSTVQAHS
jgi:hypothetical protein